MKNLFEVARLLSLKIGFSLFLMQNWEGGSSIILRILSLWSTLHLWYQSCIWIFLSMFLFNCHKPSLTVMGPVSRAKAVEPQRLLHTQNASFLYSISCRKGGGSNLGAWQGLRNRWLSTGLLSHFVHRMDSFLGKNPSFCTEGGYCLWTSASFVTEAGRCVDVTGSAWV